MSARCALVLVLAWLVPAAAAAQVRSGPPAAAGETPVAIRGFGDVGLISFAAADSFETVLGSRSGPLFGGGGEVVLGPGIFAQVRVSRFQKDGERVFVFNEDVFPLGIDTTVRITPVEVSGGYRFARASRVVPYVGAGLGWHRYEETSDFADDDENVDDTHRGYHLLGGAELRLTRWFGVGGEIQWTSVPDALGQDPNGVSAAFDETNLGGVGVRVKLVVGR
jgi:opacity protein-like surface antigen